MLPTDFPERNFVFTKPEGWKDEDCMNLPVWKGKTTEGISLIISKWKLSKEDLEEINKTGEIWLSITGQGMPPVSLFTEYPFVNLNER